ncbi:alpha-L-fucosidase [Croceitalea sp. MTPC5]|nr:alpha-L-fucosidase [Croceitalea sp. MTPC5]
MKKQKQMKKSVSVLIIFMAIGLAAVQAQLSGGGDLNPDLKAPKEAQERFMDLRIGLSVHWGPSCLGGKEISWSRGDSIATEIYDNYYKQFNPINFDADEWASLMKRWGIKYMAPTGKHHDSFTLWFSDYTEYDMENAKLPIDLMKEWARVCKENNIAFGSYYSNLDWYHPDWSPNEHGGPGQLFKTYPDSPNMERYLKFMEGQVLELITQYGVEFIQFDGEWDDTYTHEIGAELYRKFREADPDVLLSTRIDKGRTFSKNHIDIDGQKYAGDYQERERVVGEGNEVFAWADHPWQAWVTIDKGQWSYRKNTELMTIDELLLDMLSALGNNGNYMINLGPRPDGTFEPDQIALMDQLGEWLHQHANAIYGTRGGPYYPFEHGVSTRRKNKAWLFVIKPNTQKIELAQLKQGLQGATIFGTNQTVPFKKTEAGTLVFDLTVLEPNQTVSVIELSYAEDIGMEAKNQGK